MIIIAHGDPSVGHSLIFPPSFMIERNNLSVVGLLIFRFTLLDDDGYEEGKMRRVTLTMIICLGERHPQTKDQPWQRKLTLSRDC